MRGRIPLAHWFLYGGGALGLFGLILWVTLPVRPLLPPYLITALLALGYGVVCLIRGRSAARKTGKDSRA